MKSRVLVKLLMIGLLIYLGSLVKGLIPLSPPAKDMESERSLSEPVSIPRKSVNLHENKTSSIANQEAVPNGPFISLSIENGLTEKDRYPSDILNKTYIKYEVLYATHVILEIFNLRGDRITQLVNENKIPGVYHTEWDGKDDRGVQADEGIYFYCIHNNLHDELSKMMVKL